MSKAAKLEDGGHGEAMSWERNKMNWVILFVRTGAEDKLVALNDEKFKAVGFTPFIPSKETRFKNKGVVTITRKPLFPGYMFLHTNIDPDRIADKLYALLRGARHIYSALHYGDDNRAVAVRDEERVNWSRLFNEDFCIAGSIGFIEGDEVRVVSGALVGQEARIKKINRHQHKAVVEMEMMGTLREITLMLEIVEKVK